MVDRKQTFLRHLLTLLAVCLLSLGMGAGALAETPEETERYVYRYLTDEVELCPAAACGVLANMYCESRFYASVSGYNGLGLCQWAGIRRSRLVNYCSSNKLDVHSAEGQMAFLHHELKTVFPGLLTYLQDVPNTAQGAYNAGYTWLVRFESPIDPGSYANYRGTVARNMFWPKYGETVLYLKAENDKNGVLLSWTGKVSEKQVILRTLDRDKGFEKLATVSKSTRTYTDKTVKRRKQYYYYICTASAYKKIAKEEPQDRSNIAGIATVRTIGDADCQIKLSARSFTYSGKAVKPGVKITYKGKKLKNGKDYTLTFQNNIDAGKASVTITGKGEYAGSTKRSFTIEKKKLRVKVKDLKLKYAKVKKKAVTPDITIVGVKTPKYKLLSSSDEAVAVIRDGKLVVKGQGEAEVKLLAIGDKNHKSVKAAFTIRVV